MKKVLYLVFLFFIASPVIAQLQDADRNFGINGIIKTKFDQKAHFSSLALQPDEKIIAAGWGDSCFILSRYKSKGITDNHFGDFGIVKTKFDKNATGVAVGVQPGGKIIMAGYTYDTTGSRITKADIVLVRYNTDGSLDASFGTNGIVTADIKEVDVVNDMKIQPDGKIAITGYCKERTSFNTNDILTAVFSVDGVLDITFGGVGYVITEVGFLSEDYANALAIQSDGSIIVGGYIVDFSQTLNSLMIKYNLDGTLNASFGENGMVLSSCAGEGCYIEDLEVQNDGKIVTAGATRNEEDSNIPTIKKYKSNGELDSSFGKRGTVYGSAYYGKPGVFESVALQADGKIISTGEVESSSSSDLFVAIVRYTERGKMDNTFGDKGRIFSRLSDKLTGQKYPIAIQSDGNILSGYNRDSSFVIFRIKSKQKVSKPAINEEISLKTKVSIYPNPVSDKFFIKGLDASGATTITITNIYGTVVKKIKLNGGQSMVDISRLNQGAYILTAEQNNHKYTVQLIKR